MCPSHNEEAIEMSGATRNSSVPFKQSHKRQRSLNDHVIYLLIDEIRLSSGLYFQLLKDMKPMKVAVFDPLNFYLNQASIYMKLEYQVAHNKSYLAESLSCGSQTLK